MSLTDIRSLSLSDIDYYRKAWKTKIRRQYYFVGRVAATIVTAIYSIRGMFSSSSPKIVITEEDIFPEIKIIDDEERREQEKQVELEEQEMKDSMPAGAKELVFYRNCSILADQQERLRKHNQRVKELEQIGKS